MDSLFAIQGKDFVVMCADTSMAQSILKFKSDEDKIRVIGDKILLGMSGQACDRLQFGDYIERNIELNKFRTGMDLGISESANFIRNQLAIAIRKSPYQVSTLLAGLDSEGKPALYWLDYLGSMSQVTRGCHGYVMSLAYLQDLSLEAVLEIVEYCKAELKTRFMMDQPNFITKVISKVER